MEDKITFVTGCAINKDMYYVACAIDEFDISEPYTVMCFYQDLTPEKWFYHKLPGWRVTSTVFPYPKVASERVVYALDENGRVEAYSRNGSKIDKIPGAGLDNQPYSGYVGRIREIKNNLYVSGYNGQVYKKDGEQWIFMNQGLERRELHLEKENPINPEDFHKKLEDFYNEGSDIVDINGLSEDDIYAVGTSGFIAYYDGRRWVSLKKKTAADLNCILVVNKDDIVIVGRYGTVLRGNSIDGFHVISRKNASFDFYGATVFQNSIYLASSQGLHILNDEIKQVDEGMLLGKNIQEVEAKDGVLWILSDKFLSRFDGKEFEYFFHPNNN